MSGDPRERGRRRSEEGYNLVLLMVLVTILNVLVAAALPAWTGMAQREKEEELIFRGLQYAEAIRVFQGRFGRPPVRLEELVEVEPRSIRQLWKDPITGEAEWGLVFANAGAPNAGGPQGNQRPQQGTELGGGTGLNDTRATGGDPDKVTTGPIVGVYSLAEGDAMKVFNGNQRYSQWQFTVDLLMRSMGMGQQPPNQPPGNQPPQGDQGRGGGAQGPGGPQGGINPLAAGPPDLSSRWIGRPWPPEIEAQMNPAGQLQQGGMPGQGAGPAQGGALGERGAGAGSERDDGRRRR